MCIHVSLIFHLKTGGESMCGNNRCNYFLRLMPTYFKIVWPMILPSCLSCRSTRESGSVLCLWYLRWSGFPTLLIWHSLYSSEGCERFGVWPEVWAERIPQTAKGAHGRPLRWRGLRHVVLLSAHTILSHHGHVWSIHADGRDGWSWSGTDQGPAQWRHLATSRLKSLRYSQD